MSPRPAGLSLGLALLLAGPQAAAQTPASTPTADEPPFAQDVAKACTARRYGLRLAAARKVGEGGAAAVAAVRAWQQEHGRDSLPVALVEAFADRGGIDEPVLALLDEWSRDREFYWRAQALRGLAERAAAPQLAARFVPHFHEFANDPAWLVRVFARHGLWLAAKNLETLPAGPPLEPETDPRARTRSAAMQGRVPELIEALGDERTFLGDPWGRRRAGEAFAILQRHARTDYRVDAPFAQNEPAIATFAALARQLTETPVTGPVQLTDPSVEFVGGVEILSCRNGDLFVRWTEDGQVFEGLEANAPRVTIGPAAWAQLSKNTAALALPTQSGVVICDKMRIAPGPDRDQCQVAPGAMPAAAADWLKTLAAAIEEAEDSELADALRDRLTQFADR